MTRLHIIFTCMLLTICSSCGTRSSAVHEPDRRALYIEVIDKADNPVLVVSTSPYDNSRDTLAVSQPMSKLVLMSSTFVACCSELGRQDAVAGVSGLSYISDKKVREGNAFEVGYDSSIEYEKILQAKPDLVVAYLVSAATPAWVTKLRSLGIRVFCIYDFMEEHPLARAQYIEAFGAMLGCLPEARERFAQISSSYMELSAMVEGGEREKVLINTPYRDQWFIPGKDSYVAQLVRDAGGVILGSEPGAQSRVISVEDALILSAEASCWLHPGWAASKEQLKAMNPLFKDFPAIEGKVYNNTLRANSEGGNDFYESGSARPDLILEDLIRIFRPETLPDGPLHYYTELH